MSKIKIGEVMIRGIPHDVYREWNIREGYVYEAVSYKGAVAKSAAINRSVNGTGEIKWLDANWVALDRITANTLTVGENMTGYSELEPYVWNLMKKERALGLYPTQAKADKAHRQYVRCGLLYLKKRMAEATKQLDARKGKKEK